MLVAQGKLDEALKAYRDSLAIRERLAAADRSNTQWQRDLSVSYDKVGDVLVAQGKLEEALKAYRDSLAITRAPRRRRSQQYAVAARSVGLVRQGRRRAGGAGQAATRRSRPTATASPSGSGSPPPIRSNTQWQRDLSVSYDKVGDVLVAQGKLEEALKAYRDSLAIAERLAAADRSNTQWQRDLSVSYDKIGDVLVAQGKLEEALKAYRDSLAIRERLAAADPQQYAVAARSVGLVRQGRRRAGGAGQARRGAQGLPRQPRHRRAPRRRRSAAIRSGSAICRSPTTRSATCWWRRASSTRRSRPTATASPSASGSPPPIRSNTQWQRDLSVSYDKVGDVLVAQGKLDEALKAYRDSLAIAERLAAADPQQYRSGSAICRCRTTRSATCWWRRASCDEALKAYRDSLAIAERLAAADPQQYAVAARSVGLVRARSATCWWRRASSTRRSRPTATASPSPSASPPPIPAIRSGSAICRCRTTRSATCWWRRASSTRRSRPTATASPSRERLAAADPQQYASGSAICRSRTTRSATCWWRRASSTRRSRPTATASPSPSASPPPIAAIRSGSATCNSASTGSAV